MWQLNWYLIFPFFADTEEFPICYIFLLVAYWVTVLGLYLLILNVDPKSKTKPNIDSKQYPATTPGALFGAASRDRLS